MSEGRPRSVDYTPLPSRGEETHDRLKAFREKERAMEEDPSSPLQETRFGKYFFNEWKKHEQGDGGAAPDSGALMYVSHQRNVLAQRLGEISVEKEEVFRQFVNKSLSHLPEERLLFLREKEMPSTDFSALPGSPLEQLQDRFFHSRERPPHGWASPLRFSDDATLPFLLEGHYRYLDERRDFFRSRQEEWTGAFFTRMDKAVAEGKLPSIFSSPAVRERLDGVQIGALDPLLSLRGAGKYFSGTHTLYMNARVIDEDVEPIFTHEASHAIEGTSWVSYTDREKKSINTRQGLRLYRPLLFSCERDARSQFTWLSEALAERATIAMLPPTYQSEYSSQECRILQLMIDLGIPESLLYEARLEDSDSKREGNTQPKVRELFQYASQTLGDGFLMRLDTYIQRKRQDAIVRGVEEEDSLSDVIWTMEGEGENFPAFLQKEPVPWKK